MTNISIDKPDLKKKIIF